VIELHGNYGAVDAVGSEVFTLSSDGKSYTRSAGMYASKDNSGYYSGGNTSGSTATIKSNGNVDVSLSNYAAFVPYYFPSDTVSIRAYYG